MTPTSSPPCVNKEGRLDGCLLNWAWPFAGKCLTKAVSKRGKAIADKINVLPRVIWPSRYNVSVNKDGESIGVRNRATSGRKSGVDYHTLSKNPLNVKRRKDPIVGRWPHRSVRILPDNLTAAILATPYWVQAVTA
ncbi:MAG: helix-turn-helix domain-containing protein [Methylobacter sp.]|nr:helix-turn-helix domain-containing protein [Methylobacter sp.]